MAELTINEWAVPVESADLGHAEIGSRDRSADGTLGLTQTTVKRELDINTRWLSRETARAVEGLVLGRGDVLHFDDADDHFYSARGRYPTGSPVAPRRAAEVLAESLVLTYAHPKLGDGCVAIESAVSNLFTEPVRRGTDPIGSTIGFLALGAGGHATSTAVRWEGSRSLLVTTGATGGGVAGRKTGAPSTGTYAGSLYLRAVTGTPQVTVRIWNATAATGGTAKTVQLSSTTWTRVEVTHTATAGDTLDLEAYSASGSFQFYADGYQLELGDVSRTWADGSRAACLLEYSLAELKAHDDLTVMLWCRRGAFATSDRLFTIGDSTDALFAYSDDGGNAVSANVIVGGVLATHAEGALSGDTSAWQHVAVVMRRNPQTASYKVELYLNGAIAANASPTSLPTLSAPTLHLGTDASGAAHWEGLIDEVVVLPWGATASQIGAWYARAFSDMPKIDVGGDLVAGGTTVAMLGEAPRLATMFSATKEPYHSLGLKLSEV